MKFWIHFGTNFPASLTSFYNFIICAQVFLDTFIGAKPPTPQLFDETGNAKYDCLEVEEISVVPRKAKNKRKEGENHLLLTKLTPL